MEERLIPSMLLAAVLAASISNTGSPTESPGEMRQTICKWARNTESDAL